VETGRGVLAQAHRFARDRERGALLSMMHRIHESELVRGPLASAYLDVVDQLESNFARARALKELLHPEQLSPDVVERALGLLQRVSEPRLRAEVLEEVTDHQAITPSVEAAYTALVTGLEGSALREAQTRLANAKSGHARRHGLAMAFTFDGPWRFDSGEREDEVRRTVEQVRAQVQEELSREREALRRSQQQIREGAQQLKQRARALAQQYRERARSLQERLRKQFGDEADVDVDVDADVDVDLGLEP
jgi:hypothetical protein